MDQRIPQGNVKQALLEAIAHELEPSCVDRAHALELAGKVIGVEWVQAKMSVDASAAALAENPPIAVAVQPADPPPGDSLLQTKIWAEGDFVKIAFGRPTEWIAMPKSQALTFAFTVLQHCGVQIAMQELPKGDAV